MTHSSKTPWEYWLERRKKNIGYLTKTDAFGEPTESQKATALAIETAKWQATQGKKMFNTSGEYSTPIYKPGEYGLNLKRTREPEGKLNGPEYNNAIDAYVKTPMDHFNILKAQGIDVSKWEVKQSAWTKAFWKAWDLFMRQSNNEYEPPDRTRLTEEFIEMFNIKEKK